ncbi:MAG: DUF3787 domain-containing protein [Tissierellia bacterium]|nr:DUF3787 domain-containing protein [Tissierellia bacterium]
MKENKNICSETKDKIPASDIYSDILCKEEETGVEIPTEDAVEDAKDWVDQENRR